MSGDIPPWVYPVGDLKARLPIAYVATQLGIAVDGEGKALCPWHDDHNPSLHFKDGDESDFFVCTPCGVGGDLLTLIRRVKECSFSVALQVATKMLEELPEAGWRVERAAPRFVPDQGWEDRLADCRVISWANANAGLTAYAYGLIDEAGAETAGRSWDEFLIGQWGWCVDESAMVLIPHRDPAGALTGVKTRRRGDPRRHCYGSVNDHLYGSWREPGADDVVLCEGESDTVWAAAHGFDALGLPSGARGPKNEWLDFLARWRRVYIAMDNDPAGQRAQRAWAAALGTQRCREVRLPPGEDLRSSGVPVADLIQRASHE